MSNRADGSEILFGKRQSPIILKALDDIGLEVNTKIRKRGISRGMVCVQESINKYILEAEHYVCDAYTEPDVTKRLNLLLSVDVTIKKMWVDIRYLLTQKALTPGEIGVLAKTTKQAQEQLKAWTISTKDSVISG